MSITLSLPLGKPKSLILDLAFADCGRAGYDFDRQAEEQIDALNKLNAMMLEEPWSKLGYRQPTYASGKTEEASGIPDFAINAVAQALAARIAVSAGVTLQPEQVKSAARSFTQLQAMLAGVPQSPLLPNTVRGSGGRQGYYRAYPYTGYR